MYGGAYFPPCHVHWIPAGFADSGNRTHYALAGREFLLLYEEESLLVKKVPLVNDCGPVTHRCCKWQIPVMWLYSQRLSAASVGVFGGVSRAHVPGIPFEGMEVAEGIQYLGFPLA